MALATQPRGSINDQIRQGKADIRDAHRAFIKARVSLGTGDLSPHNQAVVAEMTEAYGSLREATEELQGIIEALLQAEQAQSAFIRAKLAKAGIDLRDLVAS